MKRLSVIALAAAAIVSAAYWVPTGAKAADSGLTTQAATPIENVSYDNSAWRYRRHHRVVVIVHRRHHYAYRHHRRIFFVRHHHRPHFYARYY